MADHYQTLGVNQNASQDEIKRAYRSLAMKHHPDRTGGDDTKFKEIQTAYDTIGDPEKRSQYDNPQPQMSGFNFNGGAPPGFEDILSQMFNGGNPFFGHGFRQPQMRNKTLNMQTTISLEDAYNGKEILAGIQLPSGREQTIEIKIPQGIQDGTTLRLSGMGDDSVPGHPRGDIHLTVQVAPHPQFQRQNDDLIISLEVDAIDAILGKKYKINTINGRIIELTVNPGTQHDQTYAAAGYGMPSMRDTRFVGRLLINIQIKIPTNLTNDQLSLLKNIYN
jgi:DnaJ-class molecular chaperone